MAALSFARRADSPLERRLRRLAPALGLFASVVLTRGAAAQAVEGRGANPGAMTDSVRAIAAPRTPLPTEAASAGVTRFSFIAYGDTRGRLDGQALQYDHGRVVTSMLQTIATRAKGPDPIRFVVSSGDAVVDGRNAQQWNVSFVDVVSRLTTQGDVPVFPAAGNHDAAHTMVRDAPARQQALGHFYAAFRAFLPAEGSPRRLSGYPTYAIGYGNTLVLVMDSNVADDATQLAWVRAQFAGLDRTRYPNLVVVLHHPAFSSGYHGAAIVEPQAAAMRSRYLPLFRQYHVRLVLAGHEHFFEHWVERYQDSTGQTGRLDEVISGGGGAPPYPYQGEPGLRDYLKSTAHEQVTLEHLVRPSMNAWENPYHYVVVHVDGERIRLEVIGIDAGADFQPYRSRSIDLSTPDTTRSAHP